MDTIKKSGLAFILSFICILPFEASAYLSCISILKTSEKNHDLYEKAVWAYEVVFKPFFVGGVRKSIDSIKKLDPKKILEIGVGTGYSLKYYPNGVSIVGADISDAMVLKSQERAAAIPDGKIDILNSSELSQGMYKEAADVVSSFSVITVVDDPQKFLDELAGYTKPGGHIVLIMHMRGNGILGFIDRSFDPVTQKLFGFTLLRKINDYNLDKFESVEVKPVSTILGYPYNHMVILKKLESTDVPN